MHKRFLGSAAILGLMLALPAFARAAEEKAAKPGKPALIVRFAALDQLKNDFRYLADLVGQGEKAGQLAKLIDSKIGKNGLEGVDAKKPFGLYGWIGEHGVDSQVVMLLPIADQKAFLGLLENQDIKPEKGEDGVYTANIEKVPAPVYFRFANDYLYVTARDKDVLDKERLLAPATVLPAGPQGMLSLTVNIDRIPSELKELALGYLDNQLADAKEKDVPDETESQKKFRAAMIDETSKGLKSLLSNGGETTLRLDLDRKSGDLALTASVQGKPGSPLAATFSELGQTKSVTAGLARKDAAFFAMLNVSLPAKLREQLGPVLKDLQEKVLAKSKDKQDREVRASLLKALMPTIKAAELDTTINLQGPGENGLYSAVAGFKIKDGANLEKTFREQAIKDPKVVKLDVEKVGEIAIHRIISKDTEEGARKAFGENPMYLAFRENVMLFSLGDNGLNALKEALKVEPTASRLVDLRLSLIRLAPLLEEGKLNESVAKKVFSNKGDDRLRVVLEGGKTLKFRLSVKAKLIEYAYKVGQAEKK